MYVVELIALTICSSFAVERRGNGKESRSKRRKEEQFTKEREVGRFEGYTSSWLASSLVKLYDRVLCATEDLLTRIIQSADSQTPTK